MPLAFTDCESLGWTIGQSIDGDVECWELRRDAEAPGDAVLLVTLDGIDYEVSIRKAGE